MELKDIRRIKKLSRQDVSDILDIPKRTIEDWEAGKRKAPDYVINLISDKLLNMTEEDIEEEKTYCVIEYDKNKGSNLICIGEKKACLELEDEKRKKLTQKQQLTKNYSTEKYKKYLQDLDYYEELKKYRAELTVTQKKETISDAGKTYLKYIWDFQKKYYNK
nr:MAG TPA: helix-turn-helix domain protein [Caudoviricetes sp.]